MNEIEERPSDIILIENKPITVAIRCRGGIKHTEVLVDGRPVANFFSVVYNRNALGAAVTIRTIEDGRKLVNIDANTVERQYQNALNETVTVPGDRISIDYAVGDWMLIDDQLSYQEQVLPNGDVGIGIYSDGSDVGIRQLVKDPKEEAPDDENA